MTAGSSLRVAAVLDATGSCTERRARALGGFLRRGLLLQAGFSMDAVTHLFFAGEPDRELHVALAPTRDVRLIQTPKLRADVLAAALAALAAGGGADLYIFPGGPLGTELAARLAARTGGSALSGVQWAEAGPDHLTCRRTAFSGHLTAAVELRPRPWCVALDASWTDPPPDGAAGIPPPDGRGAADGATDVGRVVETVALLTAGDVSTTRALEDVEWLEPPRTGDLEAARLLVVAGRGAGSRDGVERIAAAAKRMGAAFGVTRPVVMNAWATPDRQIGVSGTRTAPAVCVVAGASGAPAFLWGVERAGFIAAVDTDTQAPIAREADAVLVDDAVAVVEALADLVERARH